jgi:hypothetical protein
MASVSDVVRLLHRADWTRLSLAAEVNIGIDPVLSWKRAQAARPPWQLRNTPEPEGPGGFRSRRLRLLIAPGRRYREEDEDSGWVAGCDGERRWDQGGPGQPGAQDPAEMSGDPVPPLPALLCPAPLLTGFILEVRGPVTACGRDAVHVVATPLSGGAEVMVGNRRSYRISITGGVSSSQFLVFFPAEAVVDAELGVLLRLTCYVDGKPATRTELRDVRPGPVEPGVFRLDASPGVRIVEASGNLLADIVAEEPGPLGAALRTTAGAAKRTGEAVTAVRSFLDGLRRQ